MNAADCSQAGGTLREELEALQQCVSILLGQTNPWEFGMSHLVAIAVALITLGGVGYTVRQHHQSGRDDQLWNRMEWALEQVRQPDDNTKMLGLLAIEMLVTDNETSKAFRLTSFDKKLLNDIADTVLADTNPKGK